VMGNGELGIIFPLCWLLLHKRLAQHTFRHQKRYFLISVIKPDMGIEVDLSGLYIKLKSGGGLIVDSTGLSVSVAGATIRGYFDNTNLTAGVLTITHNKGLTAPYVVFVSIFNNSNQQIIPDLITGATNSVAVDLGSYGAISGTWGYEVI